MFNIHLVLLTAIWVGASLQQSGCTDLQLVIARGTGEPLFPKFGTIVGDPLYAATTLRFGGTASISGYAVNFPADLECDSPSIGGNDTVNHLNSQSQACPNQVFALVGYSQGGEVIHRAAAVLNPTIRNRIYALTMLGDSGNRPNAQSPVGTGPISPFPADLANRTMESCAPNDPVCSNTGTNPLVHLGYSLPGTNYISSSADYIFKQYQSKGACGPVPAAFGGPGTGQPNQPTPANTQALAELVILLKLINPTATVCPTYPSLAL